MHSTKDSGVLGAGVFEASVPLPTGTHLRADARLACYGLVRISFDGQSQLGMLTDVAAGGAFVWIDQPPRVGAKVEFALLQPGSEIAYGCSACVVRSESGSVALAFDTNAPGLPSLLARSRWG